MKNPDGSLSNSGSDEPNWLMNKNIGVPSWAKPIGGQNGIFHRPNLPVEGGAFVHGVPQPHISNSTSERIQTLGLLRHHRGSKNGLIHGGSFLPLG